MSRGGCQLREAKIIAVTVAALFLIAWAVAPVFGNVQAIPRIVQAQSDVWEPLLVASSRTIIGLHGSNGDSNFEYDFIDEDAFTAAQIEEGEEEMDSHSAAATKPSNSSTSKKTGDPEIADTLAQTGSYQGDFEGPDYQQAAWDDSTQWSEFITPDWSEFAPPEKSDQEIISTKVDVAVKYPPITNSKLAAAPITSIGKKKGEKRVKRARSPQKQIQSITQTLDRSIADGSISGTGRGRSSTNRSRAFRNMVCTAQALIVRGHTNAASHVLANAYRHCDGKQRPGDLVHGKMRVHLAGQISELLADLD